MIEALWHEMHCCELSAKLLATISETWQLSAKLVISTFLKSVWMIHACCHHHHHQHHHHHHHHRQRQFHRHHHRHHDFNDVDRWVLTKNWSVQFGQSWLPEGSLMWWFFCSMGPYVCLSVCSSVHNATLADEDTNSISSDELGRRGLRVRVLSD